MTTYFQKLNREWDAEPNAPDERVGVVGSTVYLEFVLAESVALAPFSDPRGHLRFEGVSRYRLGPTNDEGWYAGQCRFSGKAPRWGDFYEVAGDLRMSDRPLVWQELTDAGAPGAEIAPGLRHFLFYLRDVTFECQAESFEYVPGSCAEAGVDDFAAGDTRDVPLVRGTAVHDISSSLAQGRVWWAARRRRFNTTLLWAGLVGAFVFVGVVSLLPAGPDKPEFTIVAILPMSIVGLVYLAVANLLYNFGAFAERFVPPDRRVEFRPAAFAIGRWTCAGLPVAWPVLIGLAELLPR